MSSYYDPPQPKHTDNEIVNVLWNDFPKVFEEISEYLDTINE